MRDPKAMAQTLRSDLAAKAIKLTHSESLEIISHVLGYADWNTMSAVAGGAELVATTERKGRSLALYPAIPVRDEPIFPVFQFPLWIRREKTLRALEDAFKVQRQIVIVAQKSEDTDDPSMGDVYSVGVLARVIDVSPPSEAFLAKMPKISGSTEVTIQPLRRVRILSFASDSGGYHADVREVDEGAIEGAPDLATAALTAFTKHADAHGIQSLPALRATSVHGDAGRLADSLAIQSRIPLAQKQELLEIFEPIPRLKRLIEMLEAA